MFGARWEAATPAERDFLVAMSRYPEPVARGDIARELDRPTQALGMALNRLVDKNIIEPAEHGRLRFTMRGFGAFVRAQADESVSGARPGRARDLTDELLAYLLEGAEDLPELR